MSETPSNSSGVQRADHVQQIYKLLGGRPVLLPIPAGTKGPRFNGWQKLTWDETQDPNFTLRVPEQLLPLEGEGGTQWRSRRFSELIAAGNIGVLLGEPSILEENGRTWRLCSIDVDDDAGVEAFAAANPALMTTLQTCGHRGRNFWVWVEGAIEPLQKIFRIAEKDHPSEKVPGKVIKAGGPDLDLPFGEWRSTGGQTVVWGVHPDGMNYQILVSNPPARVRFEEINWPAGLFLPWLKAAEEAALKKASEALLQLQKQHGEPWTVSAKGKIAINQSFFAAFYATKHQILHSAEEQRFFRYQGDKSGLWSEQTQDSIRWEMAGDIKQISDEQDGAEGANQLINARTSQLMNALILMLRGCVEKWKAFERQICPKTNRPRALVHLRNGMLDLDESPPVLRLFSPEFYSRNQLTVALDEKAVGQRFEEFLKKAVAADDIDLMQKFAGQMLLGVNLTQKLLILTGTAGGGKSTFVNIIAEIIGRVNVAQLRTKHLGERFEIFGFLDKTLLIGVDVPGNFMMIDGAEVIKGLCGGDLMDAEAKTGNRRFQVKGEFNILITCNSRLKVKLDGDGDAWRRRLGIVEFAMPKPAKPDPNFVQTLIAQEGSAILNWMIEGAIKLITDIEATGGLVLSKGQKDRVESLLAESDSVRDFVTRGCARAGKDHKVTGEQMQTAYIAHCEARGWTPLPGKTVGWQLPDLLLQLHGATQANDIKGTDNKAKRGYRGVEILPVDDGDLPPAVAIAPAGAQQELTPDEGPF